MNYITINFGLHTSLRENLYIINETSISFFTNLWIFGSQCNKILHITVFTFLGERKFHLVGLIRSCNICSSIILLGCDLKMWELTKSHIQASFFIFVGNHQENELFPQSGRWALQQTPNFMSPVSNSILISPTIFDSTICMSFSF